MKPPPLPRACFTGGPKCGETHEVYASPIRIARVRADEAHTIVYDSYRLHQSAFGGFVYRYEGEEEAESE